MTKKELENRVAELEKTVADLEAQLAKANGKKADWQWWREGAGRFANDPVFDEIVRLGREYRESLHPDYKKKKAAKKKKAPKKKVAKNEPMLILDTDLLALVQREEGEVYARLTARLETVVKAEKIGVTIISCEEQMRGWLAFIAGARTAEKQLDAYQRLHELFDDFHDRTILDFDRPAVQQFELLVKAKLRIGTMDLKIAAIALANNANLLSRNLKDYRKVPGLQVEDWTLP